MEMWAFRHKETKELLRFNKIELDDDNFGIKNYFSESEYQAPWFSYSREDCEYILNSSFIHALDSMIYKKPNTDYIDMTKYDIVKFVLDN